MRKFFDDDVRTRFRPKWRLRQPSCYVRARWHNELGFGPYSLSEPEYETPTWNAPGAPPPVRLLNSSAVSVAVAWDRPTEDGGAPVMGYELWLDSWEGGASRIVFDGSDQPDTMAFTVRTKTSVGVESGKQYRFTVRAVNYCSSRDTDLLCYGEFSPVSVFTVRAPRAPLAPMAPRQGSTGGIGTIAPGDASIAVHWDAPVDNGGSNITSYQLWMAPPGREFTKQTLDAEICVEINHWFGGSPPNFRTLYLGQIEVDSADFWTNRLLSSSSRSTAKESGPNSSITRTLKSG